MYVLCKEIGNLHACQLEMVITYKGRQESSRHEYWYSSCTLPFPQPLQLLLDLNLTELQQQILLIRIVEVTCGRQPGRCADVRGGDIGLSLV